MRFFTFLMILAVAVLAGSTAQASIAYGSINNFDCVNDTGQECHGFEIEIDDIHCSDVTYTYDWNHYGPPKLREDNSDPAHPKCFIRHEAVRNPDGSWSAYTAIPSGPITPTDGHQFTDPSVNFGGEHFGVGYYGTPTAVKYNWLVDDGAGNLTYGGVVNISTPVFSYAPPAPALNIPAQVQAVIVPVPEVPVKDFGEAVWVKETKTQSHNNNKVELKDLVSDDPNDPNDKNWKNGEADEVEVEWRLMQTEFSQDNGGKNGELAGAPEDLANGDEVITRRYDFYQYVGPLDPDTGEAKVDSVGPDGIHGNGTVTEDGVTTDYSNVIVVGDYLGAQMAGFDAGNQLGLIDNLQDAEVNTPYVNRRIVIAGTPPITTTITGSLPVGMVFNTTTGILNGTPVGTGTAVFTVHSTDAAGANVTKSYTLNVVEPGAGGGGRDPFDLLTPYSYFGDANTDINADGVCDAEELSCFSDALKSGANPDLTAVYLANRAHSATDLGEYVLQLLPGLDSLFGAWEMLGFAPLINEVFVGNPGFFAGVYDTNTYDHSQDAAADAVITACHVAWCGQLGVNVTTAAVPAAGGTTSGDGTYPLGNNVTVVAQPNIGYSYVNWTVAGQLVSAEAIYTFAATEDVALEANFSRNTHVITTSAAPAAGGTTGGGGTVYYGDETTVTATANAGYQFVSWTEGGVVVSNSASFSFVVDSDLALVANFTPITYTIGVSAGAGGSASGGGTYNSGANVIVSATPSADYQFVNWTEGGVAVSNSPSYTFTASTNRTLVANFVRITYTIALSAAPVAGGTVSGGGTVDSGTSVTVSATASAGFKFVNWTEDGAAVSTSSSYTFTASANRTLVANFVVNTYTVSLSASPSAGGTVSGGGTVNSGATVTAKATANAGYQFANWTEGGAVVSTASSYTFTASANRTLVANFAPITYTVSLSASPAAGGTVNGAGTYNTGTSVTVVATAAPGYKFSAWKSGTTTVSSSASYTFTLNANKTLVATFTVLPTPTVKALTVGSPVKGGNNTPGTVTLSSPAPAGGVSVALTSSKTVLKVPATLSIAAGQSSGSFTATTSTVTSNTSVTVKAALGSSSKSVSVSVTK